MRFCVSKFTLWSIFNGAFAPSNAIMTNKLLSIFGWKFKEARTEQEVARKWMSTTSTIHFLHLTQGHVQMLCDIYTQAL